MNKHEDTRAGSMPLKAFTYPLPETRFLHAGTSVYKFKIRYGSNINGEEVENKESIVKELEDDLKHLHMEKDESEVAVKRRRLEDPADWNFLQPNVKRTAVLQTSYTKSPTEFELGKRKRVICQKDERSIYNHSSFYLSFQSGNFLAEERHLKPTC
ncbi:membrane-anchored junction protein isoform X2 [Ambystoma mexicanum]|uniref:membrane-anchored junction protein isoform X2 n=1 Tax=Ambystoma mexicanum TaxID=8296 RepID=UPI0037E738C5